MDGITASASTGIKTYALVDEPIPNPATGTLSTNVEVTWSENENGWVIAAFGIGFSRKAEGTGLDNVWVALAADGTRERVVWDEKLGLWVKANESDSPTAKWDPVSLTFINL